MNRLQLEFADDEVLLLAVASAEPLSSVLDYVTDTGMPVPILLDAEDPSSGGCDLTLPGLGEPSLYEHYRARVGDPYRDPPFPLQVVLGREGQFLYGARSHQPGLIADVLRAYLATD